jgi:hypothetical protein
MKGVVVGLLVVLGLLGGFYGGLKYGEAHAAAPTTGSGIPRGVRPSDGGGFGSAVSGPITSVGNGTITVHDTRTNKDVTVSVGGSTTISKVTQGSTSDLTKNTIVNVIGPAGSDGTVNARAIQIGGGFGRRRPGTSPSPTS